MTSQIVPRLLTPAQAGEVLGLTPRALEERRRRGDGPPFIRVGRTTVRYALSDVDAWVAERRFSSTAAEAAQRG